MFRSPCRETPGPTATHRIPQAFDTRPSLPFLGPSGEVLNPPDELMIDWGDLPPDSPAQIYWPDVASSDVLALAARLYGTGLLTAVDANTIGLKSVKGVTYIPIPSSSLRCFAGLLTVDLPLGVKKGQQFTVVIRRISTAQYTPVQIQLQKGNPGPAGQGATGTTTGSDGTLKWRYVTGAFEVKIPVTTEEQLLGEDENTLAIFKARLVAMSPQYRWYPVLKRYIGYLSGRIDASGGNVADVPPSLHGFVPRARPGQGREDRGESEEGEERCEYTGKVCGLVFDRFGDFDGFLLDTEDGERRFYSRERDMRDLAEAAWRERIRMSVLAERDEPYRPLIVILLDPPVGLEDV
jgi:hypothetical protein